MFIFDGYKKGTAEAFERTLWEVVQNSRRRVHAYVICGRFDGGLNKNLDGDHKLGVEYVRR